MARIKNLMNMAISGKVGNVVVCSGPIRGDYVRAVPEFTKERTEKQLSLQNQMGMTSKFLSPLKPLIEEVWQKDRYIKKTAYGSAFSHMKKNAFREGAEGVEIDYSRVLLSSGSLVKPEGVTAVRDGSHLEISWADAAPEALPEDKAVLVVFSESRELSVNIREKAVRGDGLLVTDLPGAYRSGTLHVYLLFVSRNGRYASDSVYVAC